MDGVSLARVRRAPSITVIIPSLDEESRIGEAVASVAADASEVIVVDGGSADGTVHEATAAGARVVQGIHGRGAQMEAGARLATGEWLVFLHADTRLEKGWADVLRDLDAGTVGGAFCFRLDSPRRRYRLVEAGARLRCAALALPYGDQALFTRRQAFVQAGGFGNTPILEDVDLVRRLRRCGRLAFPSVRAVTSARRWEEHGFLRTTLINWLVMALDRVGYPREHLARLYRIRSS